VLEVLDRLLHVHFAVHQDVVNGHGVCPSSWVSEIS
jgi:hypothetical protein